MPRANRYFIPGYVWHITHRCHQKKFLLRFGRDRQVWIRWLFEAKKRYDLEVLNFTVTSNHIHLLAYGGEDREAIPRSMQLIRWKVGNNTCAIYACATTTKMHFMNVSGGFITDA